MLGSVAKKRSSLFCRYGSVEEEGFLQNIDTKLI
jgi:hypothetical protein